MPNRDMNGPRGMGPMTGRGFGYGAGNFGYGRRNRFGGGFHGRGFGFGRNTDPYYENAIPNASRKQILENQMNMLKDQISSLERELSNLNDDNQKKKEGE
ncbi:MAG: DUF5320 domain-containing protein [Melioribacteraceae bacterium]|nr:DUF5320 domain-containing protein [Melioribacteraceae bacterium]